MKNLEQLVEMNLSDWCTRLMKDINWSNKDVYAQYLAQTYYYVNHSEKLLALCIALFKNEDRSMMRRFIKHLSEESAHDQLLLNDLKNLGYSIDDIEESSATKIFWETQYYKIEHEDPAILMGYIFFLEDLAGQVGSSLTQEVETLYGKKCSTFLRLHAEEDPDHVEKARSLIQSLPVSRQVAIARNHEQSMRAYCMMMEEVMRAGVNNIKSAA